MQPDIESALDFYAAAGEIKWLRLDEFTLESACGRWRVSRARVDDVWRYAAWRLEPPPEGRKHGRSVLLGAFDTAAEAQAACR